MNSHKIWFLLNVWIINFWYSFPLCVSVCTCKCRCQQRPEVSGGGARAKSHCEETDVGSGDWTWVLCKSNVVILNENPHRLIIGVALLEMWSYRFRRDLAGWSVSLGGELWGFRSSSQLSGSLLLPVDPDLELSVPLQHPVCLWLALLPGMIIMDQTSELQPSLIICFLIRVVLVIALLHSNITQMKTSRIHA